MDQVKLHLSCPSVREISEADGCEEMRKIYDRDPVEGDFFWHLLPFIGKHVDSVLAVQCNMPGQHGCVVFRPADEAELGDHNGYSLSGCFII